MGMFGPGPGGARGPFGGPSQDMMDNPYPTEDAYYGVSQPFIPYNPSGVWFGNFTPGQQY